MSGANVSVYDIEAPPDLAANPRPIGLEQARSMFRALSQARERTRNEAQDWAKKEADAEFDRAKTQSLAFAKAIGEGKTAAQSEIDAKAAAADAKKERDYATAMRRSCEQKLEALEGDRAGVNKLADMSLSRNWGDG